MFTGQLIKNFSSYKKFIKNFSYFRKPTVMFYGFMYLFVSQLFNMNMNMNMNVNINMYMNMNIKLTQ